jgi:bifunctional DNase/RNase
MQEMRVVAIGVEPNLASPVLLLREASAEHRVLPVWIGVAEANAIELELHHVTAVRPTAHHLIGQVINFCGRRLERVCVTMLDEGVFHAELVISPDLRVSARVSDAVALALHLDAPIHAADTVLDQAALADVRVVDIDDGAGGGDDAGRRPGR